VATFGATASDLVDGSDPVVFSVLSGATFALGTTTVTYSATDAHGNSSAGSFTVTVVDTTPPALSITAEPADPTNLSSANFTFSGSDAVTSTANLVYKYSLDGVNYWTLPGNTLSLSGLADGRYTLSVRAIDEAGNVSTPVSYSWTVDTTAPVTTASVSGQQGTNGWYTGPATVSLSATDPTDATGDEPVSGVAQTYYAVQIVSQPDSTGDDGTK